MHFRRNAQHLLSLFAEDGTVGVLVEFDQKWSKVLMKIQISGLFIMRAALMARLNVSMVAVDARDFRESYP